MLRKLLIPVLIIAVSITLISLLYAIQPKVDKRQQLAEPLIRIESQMVQFAQHNVELPSQGLVTAQTNTVLSAQVSGLITAINDGVRKQGEFARGDTLITLDDRDYRTAVELARAQLREADVALQQEQARAQQAERDWQRLNKQKAASDLVLRKPQLMAAQARLDAVQAQLDQAELNLERTKIRAPFAGASAQLLVGLGQYVTPGTPLANVLSTQDLEVALPISAQWRNLIADSSAAINVRLVTAQGESLMAKLIRQSAMIDTSSRQLTLVALIPKAHAGTTLMAGDYVNARIQGKVLEGVAALPAQALVNGKSVWQVVDGRLQKQAVELAWQDDEQIYIKTGLESGAIVNITPLAHVVSGTRVELLP